MATRVGRRRKLSLHVETLAAKSPPPPVPSSVVMATCKRSTRRHKENQTEDNPSLGQFVKFPQDTPIGKKIAPSETNEKFTKEHKKKKTIPKEDQVTLTEKLNVEDNEKTENRKLKAPRVTRSNKNVCIDIPDGNLHCMPVNEIETGKDVSPKLGKKKRNKKNVFESNTRAENVSNIEIPQNKCSNNLFETDKNTKKPKKKGKGKKNIESGTHGTHPVTLYSNLDTMKTAGSTMVKSSLETLEKSSTSLNISADSFHSAASSSPYPSLKPVAATLSLPSTQSGPDKSNSPLDTTFDKNSKNSTITLSADEALVVKDDSLVNYSSTPNNITSSKSISSSKKSNFHSAASSSPHPSLKPVAATLSLPSTHIRPHQSRSPLDTTFDKNSKTSTITLSADEALVMTDDSFENQSSTPNNITSSNSISSSKKLTPNFINIIAGKSSIPDMLVSANHLSTKLSMSGDNDTDLNTTYDKSNTERICVKEKGKVSEDIFNATLELVDSSIDCTRSSSISSKQADALPSYSDNKKSTSTLKKRLSSMAPVPVDVETADGIIQANNDDLIQTPAKLTREGTFTKDGPEVLKESVSPSEAIPSTTGSTENVLTPVKTKTSLPAPGSTPYHARHKNTRSFERTTSVLNLTRSIEKDRSELRRSSCVGMETRQTRVMFCSPIWNAARDIDRKSKVIKSSLKGSNKSFIFEELSPPQQSASRKRSYTQGDAEQVTKRKKLAGNELTSSVNRLSRPKIQPSAAKPPACAPTTPSKCKPLTPRKSRSEGKPTSVRSKLPDFAALHRRQFDKMESLSECQERKAQRARQMLQFPPTGLYTLDGRRSPRETVAATVQTNTEKSAEIKPIPPEKTSSYTRFGFRMQTDINPFSIPSTKTTKPNQAIKGKVNATVVPKVNGSMVHVKINATIPSLRREKSKQMISRDKSSTAVVEKRKKENRDIIKGVRTNRRFELQMKSRNIVP